MPFRVLDYRGVSVPAPLPAHEEICLRFLLAIVAFVVAAVMIVAGIAQRTVFAPPSQLTASATVPDDARYVVIAGSALNAHPGRQTLRLEGAPDAKTQVVALGRTADVTAWLGTEK